MKGVRHFFRNYTAMAVKEHLRSQIEGAGDSPNFTRNEIELMRFIAEGSFDWKPFFAESSTGPSLLNQQEL